MSSVVNIAHAARTKTYSRSFLDWGFLALATCFQLASAKTTFTGTMEFLSDSSVLAGMVTFAIQAGLILGGERVVQIISHTQVYRTSIIPALLLTAVTFTASVVFSGFGFYKHYAYAEGNRAVDFNATSAEVRKLAGELERYRTDALAASSAVIKQAEDERRRAEARVNNLRLNARSRSGAQVRRDQLARQISVLTKMQSQLTALNVIGTTTESTAEKLRQVLIGNHNAISDSIAQGMPGYLKDHPLPEGILSTVPAADVQTAFKRDIEQRQPPAMFSLAVATGIDLASLLALACNIFVSSTEQRIVNAKRKIRRTWNSIFPLSDTGDTFSVVRVRLSDLSSENDFEIVFNSPDWALRGSDLEANREAIIDRVHQRLGDLEFLPSFYTTGGEPIDLDRSLLEQLSEQLVVCLRTTDGPGKETDDGE